MGIKEKDLSKTLGILIRFNGIETPIIGTIPLYITFGKAPK